MPFRAQRSHEVAQPSERGVERFQLHDLRADVHVDAHHANAFQRCRFSIHPLRIAVGNTELRLPSPRRDLPVRAGIDIRVDAKRDRGRHALSASARSQQVELRLGLDVEALDPRDQRRVHLVRRFADAGEHDLACRNACCDRPLQFPSRNHVRARAQRGEQGEDRLVGVRLHGIADQWIERGERLTEDSVVTREGSCRVAIERRAYRSRDLIDRHVLGMHPPIVIVKVVQRLPLLVAMPCDPCSAMSTLHPAAPLDNEPLPWALGQPTRSLP